MIRASRRGARGVRELAPHGCPQTRPQASGALPCGSCPRQHAVFDRVQGWLVQRLRHRRVARPARAQGQTRAHRERWGGYQQQEHWREEAARANWLHIERPTARTSVGSDSAVSTQPPPRARHAHGAHRQRRVHALAEAGRLATAMPPATAAPHEGRAVSRPKRSNRRRQRDSRLAAARRRACRACCEPRGATDQRRAPSSKTSGDKGRDNRPQRCRSQASEERRLPFAGCAVGASANASFALAAAGTRPIFTTAVAIEAERRHFRQMRLAS